MGEFQSVAGNHFQRQQLLLRMEYEYEINARTGAVLKAEQDQD